MIIYISHYHIELCHGSNEGRLGESQYDTAKYQYSLALKIKKIYNYICKKKIQETTSTFSDLTGSVRMFNKLCRQNAAESTYM